MTLPPDFAAGLFYNDLEHEQARRWTALLMPQSMGYEFFCFFLFFFI